MSNPRWRRALQVLSSWICAKIGLDLQYLWVLGGKGDRAERRWRRVGGRWISKEMQKERCERRGGEIRRAEGGRNFI
jgi:hypothetical protein